MFYSEGARMVLLDLRGMRVFPDELDCCLNCKNACADDACSDMWVSCCCMLMCSGTSGSADGGD